MRRRDEATLGPNVGGARAIARKLLKDAGIIEVPVSLQKVLDHMRTRHDLAVLRIPFDRLDGMLVVVDDGPPTLVFNPDRPWVRRRFTVSHEVGHYLLGHGGCSAADEHAEKEANQFAAELLMPLAMIKVDYKKDRDLEKLAAKYVVSQEAMCLHLMECKVL